MVQPPPTNLLWMWLPGGQQRFRYLQQDQDGHPTLPQETMVRSRRMSCSDCPDAQPRPSAPVGCNYLAYSGGPLHSLYRLLDQAIPVNVGLLHGRPTIYPDGSLEFTGIPPILAGYRREGSRLYPVWPPCMMRMLKVQVVDGLLTVTGICANAESERFSLEVAVDQCQTCKVRQPTDLVGISQHRIMPVDGTPRRT